MDVFGSSLEKAKYLQDPPHTDKKENNNHISTENDVTIVTISASIKLEETADSGSYQGANELQNINHSTGREGNVAVMPTWHKEEKESNSVDRPDHEEILIPCSTAYDSEKLQFNDNAKIPILKSSVQEHLRQQTGLKRFSCMYCEKCYTRKDHLIRHQPTHTGVKNFKCSECPKSFADKSTLSRHMRIHTGEKPFSCTACGKSFTDKSTFNQHLRTHTGFRPYQCTECNKTFSKRSGLQQHLITHTGLKPFPCTECKKSFTQKSTLLYHMGMHKGIRRFHCTECDKGFMHKSHLKKHLHFHNKTKNSFARVTGEVYPEGPSSVSVENSNRNAFLSHSHIDVRFINEAQLH